MERRKNLLSSLKACRFCLGKDESLSSLYDKYRTPRHAVPLSLQIMSCVSIEVFPSDRMPFQICERCRYFMDMFYHFKQICRKSDEAIMHFVQKGEELKPVFWQPKLVKAFRSASQPSPKKGKGESSAPQSGKPQTDTQLATRSETNDEESDDCNDNVFNMKIGDGTDDDSTCIQVVKAGDKITITKENKSKTVKATLPPNKAAKETGVENANVCKFCAHKFSKKSSLIRHMESKHKDILQATAETESDQHQYSCDQCEENFDTQDELMYHSAKHATENLTCPLCHEKFDRVEQVTDHIKTHAESEEFMCELCELMFISKQKLDLHVLATHEEEMAQGRSVDGESMDMDEEDFEDNDSNINVKEEDDHMVVEIKKPDEFIIMNSDHASSQIKAEEHYYEGEDDEFQTTYTELTTVDTLALSKEISKKQQGEKIPTLLNKVVEKTPEKHSERKGDAQLASIIRKADEIKRKAKPKTIEIISSVTLNPELKLTKSPNAKTLASSTTPVKADPASPNKVTLTKEQPAPVAKPETTTSAGASEKSLKLLEKELQELKRTNNFGSNDSAKSSSKNLEVLRNRRPQMYSTTPKTRSAEEKKSTSKTPQVEKKVPERRAITKENKEPKEREAPKTNNNNTSSKEDGKDKEKETTKVVRNGRSERPSTDEAPRRSSRPSKIKDYAKMVRDSSRVSSSEDTDEDDDDEEYKEEELEEEKPVESYNKSRRGRTHGKAATSPASAPAPPPAETPAGAIRKRGRPRKEKPEEVPAKVMKSTQEDEVDKTDDESKQKADKPEAKTSKETKKTDKPDDEATEMETTTTADEDKQSPTKAGANPEVAKSLMMSPTGQTLKKVPIKSLPPGVKPLPLPVSSRTMNTGELCEMQIGKKTVKVHKIVMTKAEVEAMAKQGLVEMKDGTMVLKQGIKLPTQVKPPQDGETPSKIKDPQDAV